MNRDQTRADDVATDRCRGHKRADRFADPAYPKNAAQRQTIAFRKEDPPGKSVEKNRDAQVVANDTEDCPAGSRDRFSNLRRALANQERGEKSSAREREKIKS